MRYRRERRAGLDDILARMTEWVDNVDLDDDLSDAGTDQQVDTLVAALEAADDHIDATMRTFLSARVSAGMDTHTSNWVAFRQAKKDRWRLFLQLQQVIGVRLTPDLSTAWRTMVDEAVANVAPRCTVWEFDRSAGRMRATVILDVDHDLSVDFVLVDASIRWAGLTVVPVEPVDRLPSWRTLSRSGVGSLLEDLLDELCSPDTLWMCPPEWTEATMRPERHGRRGTPDHVHALWAARYVAALEDDPHQPVQLMLRLYPDPEHGGPYSTSSMTAKVNKARRKGFLTSSPPGRAGGVLTDRAKDALAGKYGQVLPGSLVKREGTL